MKHVTPNNYVTVGYKMFCFSAPLPTSLRSAFPMTSRDPALPITPQRNKVRATHEFIGQMSCDLTFGVGKGDSSLNTNKHDNVKRAGLFLSC